MNRQQYMKQLEAALSRIPKEERENVLQYYNEYFDEAGPEQEQEIIKRLGPPQKLASQIKAQSAVKDLESQPAPTVKKGISTIWLVILGIFAAPVALPVAIAVAAVAFSLVLVVVCLLVAASLAALGVFAGGIAAIAAGFGVLFATPASAIFAIGVGLIMLGATLLLSILTILAAGAFFRLMARLLNRGFHRKERGNEQ